MLVPATELENPKFDSNFAIPNPMESSKVTDTFICSFFGRCRIWVRVRDGVAFTRPQLVELITRRDCPLAAQQIVILPRALVAHAV